MSDTVALILVLAILVGGVWLLGNVIAVVLMAVEDIWLRCRRPIKVGARWIRDSENPFEQSKPVTITGVAKGYVEYRDWSGYVSSERAHIFRRYNRPSEDAARKEGV